MKSNDVKPDTYLSSTVVYGDLVEMFTYIQEILELRVNDTDISLCTLHFYLWQLIALFFPLPTKQVLAVCLTLLPVRVLRTGVSFSVRAHTRTQHGQMTSANCTECL